MHAAALRRAERRAPLFKVCPLPSWFNYVELGGARRPLSPLCSSVRAFSTPPAGSGSLPTERLELQRIPKPGLRHSWLCERRGDLIARPPSAPCQSPSGGPDTPESNI
ncbi:hypothetical protein EYF80_035158 [Liparis tanakae]|uniref:Uncharacterized protein n=1 Tax=Liparis tanakae TaxID=230148 RepID=A0A4Z2GMD7_9TELE|nr:hypothetical protein EYF80_035158 [Liparis tanakae]